MRERVAKRIRGDGAEGLTVCTFHALGLKLLQIEHAKAGLRRGFSIFDADDTASQLKDLLPGAKPDAVQAAHGRSEEHTSELQSLMRISYAVCCLYKKK